jgi:hypothetical protein
MLNKKPRVFSPGAKYFYCDYFFIAAAIGSGVQADAAAQSLTYILNSAQGF